MKTRHIILIAIIWTAAVAAAVIWTGYRLNAPPQGLPVTTAETPTQHTPRPGISPDTLATCGHTDITGAWIGDTVFRVTAVNSVEIAQKEFTFKFPERTIKHLIIPGVSLGGDYDSQSRKLYMMYGVELNYLRMFGRAGVGAGVWYRQSFGQPDRIDAGVNLLAAVGI